MGRARSGCQSVGNTRLRGRGRERAGELSDHGFAAVFGFGRGAHSTLVPTGGSDALAVARDARLAAVGGVSGVLSRVRRADGDLDAFRALREELADVVDELRDAALTEGWALRAELARLLGAADVAELPLQRLNWDMFRVVERNRVRHDEAWLRARALLVHDKNLARRLESLLRDRRGDVLTLSDDEQHALKLRVWGPFSGGPQVKPDWAAFVAELRAAGDLHRMKPADLRLRFAEHVDRSFERAADARRTRRR